MPIVQIVGIASIHPYYSKFCGICSKSFNLMQKRLKNIPNSYFSYRLQTQPIHPFLSVIGIKHYFSIYDISVLLTIHFKSIQIFRTHNMYTFQALTEICWTALFHSTRTKRSYKEFKVRIQFSSYILYISFLLYMH